MALIAGQIYKPIGGHCGVYDSAPDASFIRITSGSGSYYYYQILDSKFQVVQTCCGCFTNREDNFELVKSKSIKRNLMNKISSMMRRILDKDMQVLVKAGFVNGDLDLTEAGQGALNSILFQAHKEELVELAKEVLEEEKDCKCE